MITSEKDLLLVMDSCKCYDAIVVEGYDGVGKGRVLSLLSSMFGVVPYRPDYNLWLQHDHRYKDRWKVSGFFWDVYSHFKLQSTFPLLFDRGVISGAVYNNDLTIARDYNRMLRDNRVMHLLVVCDYDDYKQFQAVRGIDSSDIDVQWEKYKLYTERYIEAFNVSGVEYLEYKNTYNPELATTLMNTCEGCGHYSYGYCNHPAMRCKIDKDHQRCFLSAELEVQDRA